MYVIYTHVYCCAFRHRYQRQVTKNLIQHSIDRFAAVRNPSHSKKVCTDSTNDRQANKQKTSIIFSKFCACDNCFSITSKVLPNIQLRECQIFKLMTQRLAEPFDPRIGCLVLMRIVSTDKRETTAAKENQCVRAISIRASDASTAFSSRSVCILKVQIAPLIVPVWFHSGSIGPRASPRRAVSRLCVFVL